METASNIAWMDMLIRMLDRMATDSRLTVWHIGIIIAIADIGYHRGGANPVAVTRKLVMRLSHIRSLATYHKCIRQLEEYGYIKYRPSFSYYDRSTIELSA